MDFYDGGLPLKYLGNRIEMSWKKQSLSVKTF